LVGRCSQSFGRVVRNGYCKSTGKIIEFKTENVEISTEYILIMSIIVGTKEICRRLSAEENRPSCFEGFFKAGFDGTVE